MAEHLIDGEFQSDKYPTTPRGKVPLSCKDPMAQDLLWEYAQRRRAVDAAFSDDLETALRSAGYAPLREAPPKRPYTLTITREQVGSGRVVTHSQTTLDLPPADAVRVRDAVRSGLPPGFGAELTDPDGATIKLADLFPREVTE